jgi:hypothetical protein
VVRAQPRSSRAPLRLRFALVRSGQAATCTREWGTFRASGMNLPIPRVYRRRTSTGRTPVGLYAHSRREVCWCADLTELWTKFKAATDGDKLNPEGAEVIKSMWGHAKAQVRG